MTPILHLTFMSGSRDGETITISPTGSPPAVAIGRVNADGIALPDDPEVSRAHARLVVRDQEVWLEDAGSRNGTFLGEFAAAVRLTAAVRLHPGQIFRTGITRLRLEPLGVVTAVAHAVADAERSS